MTFSPTPGTDASASAANLASASDPQPAEARPSDLFRQMVVIASLGFTLISGPVSFGGLGREDVSETQGGALSEQGSFLAPAGPAFSIWLVIYLGLVGYAIWQALPRQRASARHRAVGWWIAVTIALNGLWLVAAQLLTIEWTVIVIVALLIALGITFRITVLTRTPRAGLLDALLIDGVTGLHLGWVALATVANIAAWLTVTVPQSWADAASAWGLAVLAVVAVVGIGIAWASGWRVAPALALAWGLSWLAVGRLTGEPANTAIGIGAIVVAGIVLLIPLGVAGLRLLRPEHD